MTDWTMKNLTRQKKPGMVGGNE